MRLRQPRIAPLDGDQLSAEQRELLGLTTVGGKDSGAAAANIFRTLAAHPKFLKRWLVFANHVLFKSTLPPREREILILRIGWLCRSGYEWAQHRVIGRERGLSDEEIDRIKLGADAPGWSDPERLLLRATDELHADAFISDSTWAALREHYSEQQMVDIVGAVGNYTLVSMLLNTLGVQLDEGLRAEIVP